MLAESLAGEREVVRARPYDGTVGDGSKKLTVSFLRMLRERRAAAQSATVPAVQLGSPPGTPAYDRYTYRRRGYLYVQGYHSPGKLHAWCMCGNWTFITVYEIQRKTRDCCRDCEEPSPLLAAACERARQAESED
jgi:hypothetical protein